MPQVMRGAASDSPLHGRKVLIIDDEESIRLLLHADLSARGMEVIALADGSEVESLEPAILACLDCLITDVVMPRIGGPAVAARLRLRFPDLPVLFMTGFADALQLGDALDLPATALIDKPFRLENVAEAVERLVRG